MFETADDISVPDESFGSAASSGRGRRGGRPVLEPGKTGSGRHCDLPALRRKVAAIEGRLADRLEMPAAGSADAMRLATGIADFDTILRGGIAPGLTELRLAETRDAGSGLGFVVALAVLASVSPRHPLVWIGERLVFGEAGGACRAGIAGFGLDPAALLTVRTRRLEETVWAGEEAARSGAASLVLVEVKGNPRLLGLEGTRRLHLRAQASGIPCLLLRQAGEPEPTAAPLRIRVEPERTLSDDSPAEAPSRLVGPPAFRLTVEKSADGRTANLLLEWNADEHRFQSRAPAFSGAVAAVAGDRPAASSAMGRLMAFPKDSSAGVRRDVAGPAWRRRRA